MFGVRVRKVVRQLIAAHGDVQIFSDVPVIGISESLVAEEADVQEFGRCSAALSRQCADIDGNFKIVPRYIKGSGSNGDIQVGIVIRTI